MCLYWLGHVYVGIGDSRDQHLRFRIYAYGLQQCDVKELGAVVFGGGSVEGMACMCGLLGLGGVRWDLVLERCG